MKKSILRNNEGFTLLELLISIVILAIIVIPLLNVFITGAGIEKKSQTYGEATDAAQNLSEQIQATTADTILGNAATLAPGATFYTYNSSSNTYTNTNSPIAVTSDTYYLGIPSYTYGASTFDALVTLSATDPVNTTDVSVSNQMGAYLNMTTADANAVTKLQSECGGLVSDPASLSINDLTRSISIDITKSSSSGTNTFTVAATFAYAGTINYTVVGSDGISYPKTYYFPDTERSSASVVFGSLPTGGSPLFSVYLFYNGYYKSAQSSETIPINSPVTDPVTGLDVNIFLVNTNTGTPPVAFGATLWYKYQNFINGAPVNNLVFTNLPAGKVTYIASKDYYLKKTLTVSGYLVQTNQYKRKFNINIKLYKGGSGFSGTYVLNLDSTKLN